MRALLGLLGLLATLPALAGPARQPLFDFEDGVAGWWTNPWGGGAITVSRAPEGRFGQGAVAGEYAVRDGRLNGNLISPYLPADAPWRQQPWGALSLWYRTTGEVASFNFVLGSLPVEGEAEQSYSWRLSPSPEWRRLILTPRMLWNRAGRRLDLRQLGRFLVSGSRPGTVQLDAISLLAERRAVPLRPFTRDWELWELEPGRYELLGPPSAWSCRLTTPGGAATGQVAAGAEPAVELTTGVRGEGEGTLAVEQAGGAKTLRLPVLLPAEEPPVAPLGVFPTPRKLVRGEGHWVLPRELRVTGRGAAARRCVAYLDQQLRRRHAVTAILEPSAAGAPPLLSVAGLPPLETVPAAAEAYTLRVTRAGFALEARDDRGLFNGVLSLLQLINTATVPGGPVMAPEVEIRDAPALPVRSVSIPLPTSRWGYPNDPPVPLDFFLDYLEQAVVQRKFNQVILLALNGMQLTSEPRVPGPAAWSRAEMERLLAFLRDRFIEPVPLIDSLGHASWLLGFRKDLADRAAQRAADGTWALVPDTQTINTRHPEAWPTLMKVYDEVLDIFRPQRFHIGLDEVRWQIDGIPPELRGPDDTIDDRADRLAEWVTRLHGRLRERGVETMMWTDQLCLEHNGHAPYHTARALPKLPRDIWMVNWSSSLSPLHTWELRDLGFERVLEGNSEGVHRERLPALVGNVVGLWSKVSWRTEIVGEPAEYSYQMLLAGAEYGWRPAADLRQPKVRTTRALMEAVREVEAIRALAPEPGGELLPLRPGAATVALDGWFAKPPAPLAVRDLSVPFWDRAVGPDGVVPVGRKVAALYWIQAADLDAAALAKLREDFKDKAWYQGRPIGTVTVRYADGGTVEAPLLFGWDVRSRHAEALPGAYGAVTWRVDPAVAGETAVYLRQWVNPTPDREVAELRLATTGTPATPLLLGAVARVR